MKSFGIPVGLPVKGALACALVFAVPSLAQYTYPGCSDLQASEFQRSVLFSRNATAGAATTPTLAEPIAMAFNPVRSGDSVIGADIYIVGRRGVVHKYDFTTKTSKQIGTINTAETSVSRQGDNGLMGIALDKNFASNRWIYLWYGPPRVGSNNYRGRLSRFTLGAQDTVLVSSEKILIDILMSKTHQWHAGGPMRMDAHGDLWVTIGNNGSDLSGTGSQYNIVGSNFTVAQNTTDTTWRTDLDSNNSQEWGASNTASMRGGVIRIRPDSSQKGYSIPAGNFGPHWADYFEANGNPTLAAQYRDPAKVLPEVYVKGTRSNFSIAVHPTKRWLAWGEVNYQSTNEEFNLVTKPAFTGFPYFHKNNIATPGTIIPAKVASAPTNTSPMNSGVQQLPPAEPPVIWNGSSVTATTLPIAVAIGGDIYAYDAGLKSPVKFPPHFHNTWFQIGFATTGTIYSVRIDSITVKPVGIPARVDNGILGLTADPTNVRSPLQLSYGPDGALYLLNYDGYYSSTNPRVVRITYTGSCKPGPVSIAASRPLTDMRMSLNGSRLRVLEAGAHEVSLHTAAGREVFRARGESGALYDLREVAGHRVGTGVHILRVKTAQGTFARNLPPL